MFEYIRTHLLEKNVYQNSQPVCEVREFMKNFSEAVHSGQLEEIATYYADEMEPFCFPLNARWKNESLTVGDQIATFSCSLQTGAETDLNMTCVLDKSEGYWQIIHGEIHNNLHH